MNEYIYTFCFCPDHDEKYKLPHYLSLHHQKKSLFCMQELFPIVLVLEFSYLFIQFIRVYCIVVYQHIALLA